MNSEGKEAHGNLWSQQRKLLEFGKQGGSKLEVKYHSLISGNGSVKYYLVTEHDVQGQVLRMRSWKHSSESRWPWAYAADPSQPLFIEHISLFGQSTLCFWPVSLWLFGRFLSSRFPKIVSLPPSLLTFLSGSPFFSFIVSLFLCLSFFFFGLM